MKIPSKIRFKDESLRDAFEKLKKGDSSQKELVKFLEQAFENISQNVFCGIQVPKSKIPDYYKKNYSVKNLWKYGLPRGWRLLYFIENDDIVVFSIILEWLSHKEYEKRFKY